MNTQLVAAVVDGGIPIAAGIMVTVIGFRRSAKPNAARMYRAMQWLGPAVVLFGVVSLAYQVVGATRWSWRTFSPPAGNMSAEFPGTPEPVDIEQPSPAGNLTMHRFSVSVLDGSVNFGISHRTYTAAMREAGIVPTIEQVGSNLAGSNGNRLVSSRPLGISGHDGIDVVVDNPSGMRIHTRAVIVGDTMYTATVTHVASWTDAASENRFLDSLRVRAP